MQKHGFNEQSLRRFVRERVANHDLNRNTYSNIVLASSLLMGYANYGPSPPAKDEFQQFVDHAWAYYIYAILIPTAFLMNLCAVVVIVMNRFLADRLLKLQREDLQAILMSTSDEVACEHVQRGRLRSQRAFLRYMGSTRSYRHGAVYMFVLSLPLLLAALAVKQFDRLPTVVAAPSAALLFFGVCAVCRITIHFIFRQSREFEINHEEWLEDHALLSAARFSSRRCNT